MTAEQRVCIHGSLRRQCETCEQADRADAAEAERDALRAELARWKVCVNCGAALEGPGHCSRAVSENEKGLELMLDQSFAERDALTAERDDVTGVLKALVIAWDAEQDEEFDDALAEARKRLGFTLAEDRNEVLAELASEDPQA